jgi:pullulanase/glycogen debranching enzyme
MHVDGFRFDLAVALARSIRSTAAGNFAHVVPAFADIPGLGDDLYLGHHRVLLYQVENADSRSTS